MSTKLFINAFSSLFNQDRDGSIVRVGLAPPFSTSYIMKSALNYEINVP